MFRQIREGSGANMERLGGENTGMTTYHKDIYEEDPEERRLLTDQQS